MKRENLVFLLAGLAFGVAFAVVAGTGLSLKMSSTMRGGLARIISFSRSPSLLRRIRATDPCGPRGSIGPAIG